MKMQVAPHFAVAVDKQAPLDPPPFPNAPFCFALRVHPETLAPYKGERLQIPDGHLPFLSYLSGSDDLFDGGWTVGTTLASLAHYLGCNPIIAVGMDYRYREGQKYAFDTGVPVQKEMEPDWPMAIAWMRALQKRYPETTFLNASTGGEPYWEPQALAALRLGSQGNLYEQVALKIQELAFLDDARWRLWEESVHRTRVRLLQGEDITDELAFQKLLQPLWQLWKPLFGNEDSYEPLFFQTVLDRHAAH